MTINYIYTTKMILSFDGILITDFTGSLDEAVAKAIEYINIYGFSVVDIINRKTGEILVHIEED